MVARHESNNFDDLRLAAASMVVLGHAYVLTGRPGDEPLAAHTGIGGFGELGVSVFFVISGFLVTMSYERLKDLRAFLANRCLRILPGLAGALVLTALVLGPLVTSLPGSAYFTRPQTWLYVLRNLALYPVTYRLPGVFEHNPYPDAVNGSLWTLRLEFSFYLAVPVLARLNLLNRRGLTAVAFVALVLWWAVLAAGPRLPPVAILATRNFYLFAAGAALYAWRDAPVLRRPWPTAAAALAFLAVLGQPAAGAWLGPAILPLLTIGIALRPVPGLRAAARFGDFSYGIYIYAFPVEQVLAQMRGPGQLPPLLFALMALGCTAPLAILSWTMVERPALGLKRRFGGASAETPAAPVELTPADGGWRPEPVRRATR